jgi:protein gp37
MASKIEWTNETWNPLVGCSLASPGCTNCYAMNEAWRKSFNGKTPQYQGVVKQVKGHAVWTGKVNFVEHKLRDPLGWRRPRMVFVNSMSDLFHESVPDEWIDRIFAVMAHAPQHTFQVLTKRAERMRQWFAAEGRADRVGEAMLALEEIPFGTRRVPWPLPNVWLGVSAEDQERADERIPHLLATPAAVRFVSCEPLLGQIDLEHVAAPDDSDGEGWTFSALHTGDYYTQPMQRLLESDPQRWDCGDGPYRETRLDWVIVGGESGKSARRMDARWARGLRDQCASAGVPYFFKQWGEHDPETFDRVGKSRAGRTLDGRTHDEFPKVQP